MKNLLMCLASVFIFIFFDNCFSYANPLIIESDSTWRVSTTSVEGWENSDFDDSAWLNASSPNPNNGGHDTSLVSSDSDIVATSMWSNGANSSVFLRKSFQLENYAIESAIIYSVGDDDRKIYVNGILVDSDMDRLAGPYLKTDIKTYLQKGKNVIAVHGIDYGGNSAVYVYAKIQFFNTCTDSDGDGVPDHWDTCPDTPVNSWVNKNGCKALGMYTEEQMNLMVQTILTWGDINGDKKIDLSEAIQALRVTSGVTEPSMK